LFILSNLGRLPSEFDGQYFVPYLKHNNPQIRFWAIKNIGKLGNDSYLIPISNIVFNDTDPIVKRESVSTIGRMRNENAIPMLLTLLNDSNPEIVLQAIRALLVFSHVSNISAELKKLSNHPNEIIQTVIRKNFFSHQSTSNVQYSHVELPSFMKNVVVHGDVREVMQFVPDESIHLTFTSPPYYNARSYSTYPSYQAYLDFLDNVFKQIHRVTKEGRFLVVNTSPIIIPRVSRKYSSKRYAIPFDLHAYLIKMGWEFIDDIIWTKPETSVKNRNAGFLQHRKPLGYKANACTEYVMIYRKETTKLIDWNMRQYSKEIVENSKITGEYETSNLWHIDPVFDKVHSAVFPTELAKRIIQFYSYQGDLVFDPFAGSGTTGQVAVDLGRYFFMTEQIVKYIERIKEKLVYRPLLSKYNHCFLSLEEFEILSQGE